MSDSPHIMDAWHASGTSARICGMDFMPKVQPFLSHAALCVTKGQASVFVLHQVPQQRLWFLKKFAPARQPELSYLIHVARHVPGTIEFNSCTQRRLLTAAHWDHRSSRFHNDQFGRFLDGCILTPGAGGLSWQNLADDIRSGRVSLSLQERLRIAQNLAMAIHRLEASGCSHRDISGANVFVATDGRINIIDWDSLYHESLVFQANTTIGTDGYIAPFLKGESSTWDARRSWRPIADRYALGILIAEFLLVDHTTSIQEDGSLFSQKELLMPESTVVRDQAHRLEDISVYLAWQFLSLLQAESFDACPSPRHWAAALHHELSRHGVHMATLRVPVKCRECQSPLTLPRALHDPIKISGRAIVCQRCRSRRSATAKARESTNPEPHDLRINLVCENCQFPLTKSRCQADSLRERGKSILCSNCLEIQIKTWESERRQREVQFPETTCSRCARQFRMPRVKLSELQDLGRDVFCRTCFHVWTVAPKSPRVRLFVPSTTRYR